METIHVDCRDFLDWIDQQLDDRPVNMYNNCTSKIINRDDCGCVMIQYAQDVHLTEDRNISCGSRDISCYVMNRDGVESKEIIKLSESIIHLTYTNDWRMIKNFGMLKQAITPFGREIQKQPR